MIKKILALGLVIISIPLSGLAGEGDMQLAQKKQLLNYIENEETILSAETESYEKLSTLLKEVRKDGKIYYVIVRASFIATVPVGISVGLAASSVSNGASVRPAKLVFKIAGIVFPILLVSSGYSDYKAELNEAEVEFITTNLEIAGANIDQRRQGLITLKKQLGIDTRNIDLSGKGSGSSTLLLK